jgi:WD40-like Beta Propeller Repeat
MRRATALLLVIAAAAAIGGGSANAGFPATKARLVVLSEDGGYAAPALVREDGSLYAFGFPLGIHGSVAMAPDGTRAAMVDTVPVFGITVPALLVSNLIGELQGLPVGAVAGRPAWSPDGTKIAFAGKRSGNWDMYVVALDEGAVPIARHDRSTACDRATCT